MKKVVGIIVGLLAVGALVAALVYAPTFAPSSSSSSVAEKAQEPATAEKAQDTPLQLVAGRYEPYEASRVSATGYNRTVLFFHAPWCPECRAFDAAIKEASIPEGTQILKVDYDSSTELRQKYGVTIQSTFVSVSSDGQQTSKWVGYGQDKSLSAILENS